MVTEQLTITPRIQLTSAQREALDRFCETVLTRFPGFVEEIILYGSRARGDADAESDVDLLLLVNWEEELLDDGRYHLPTGDPRYQEIVDISYDLMLNHDVLISPLLMSRAAWERNFSLRKNVERDGIRIWPPAVPTHEPQPAEPGGPIRLREQSPEYELDSEAERLEEAKAWLALADEKLPVARQLLAAGLFDEAVSKSYYVMFYAAKAALALEGIRPHRHRGLIAEFGRIYAKTGRVPKALGRQLRQAMKAREAADYDPNHRASREDAERLLADATEFLQAIKTLFENLPLASGT